MNIITRNALSPWSASGFQPAPLRGPLRVIRMGQGTTSVSLAVRDQTLATLNDAWQRASAVDAWRSENPDWQLAMGKDGDQVAELTTTIAPLLPTAEKVRRTLQSADPASWVVTSQEITDATTWATAIGAIYGLIGKHSTTLRPVTVATTPGTATTAVPTTDYTIPIAVGAGALLLGFLLFR